MAYICIYLFKSADMTVWLYKYIYIYKQQFNALETCECDCIKMDENEKRSQNHPLFSTHKKRRDHFAFEFESTERPKGALRMNIILQWEIIFKEQEDSPARHVTHQIGFYQMGCGMWSRWGEKGGMGGWGGVFSRNSLFVYLLCVYIPNSKKMYLYSM